MPPDQQQYRTISGFGQPYHPTTHTQATCSWGSFHCLHRPYTNIFFPCTTCAQRGGNTWPPCFPSMIYHRPDLCYHHYPKGAALPGNPPSFLSDIAALYGTRKSVPLPRRLPCTWQTSAVHQGQVSKSLLLIMADSHLLSGPAAVAVMSIGCCPWGFAARGKAEPPSMQPEHVQERRNVRARSLQSRHRASPQDRRSDIPYEPLF